MKAKLMVLVLMIAVAGYACDRLYTEPEEVHEEVKVKKTHREFDPEDLKAGEAKESNIVHAELDAPIEFIPEYDSFDLICGCVEAEAGNQGLYGKMLVAGVVLNRVDSPDFPDTVKEVITQRGQFTTWRNGMIAMAMSDGISEETKEAVDHEIRRRSYPELVFFSSEGFSRYGTPWKKVRDHYFSTK